MQVVIMVNEIRILGLEDPIELNPKCRARLLEEVEILNKCYDSIKVDTISIEEDFGLICIRVFGGHNASLGSFGGSNNHISSMFAGILARASVLAEVKLAAPRPMRCARTDTATNFYSVGDLAATLDALTLDPAKKILPPQPDIHTAKPVLELRACDYRTMPPRD
jgi:hypothetical protein